MLYIGGEAFQRMLREMPDVEEGAGAPDAEEATTRSSHSVAQDAVASSGAQLRHAAAATHIAFPEELTLAFGTLVRLMRRKEGVSIEQLASSAQVDMAELLAIESDSKFVPKPRTVFQLAYHFKLPAKRLLQLSGGASVADPNLRQAAVRFAARSGDLSALSSEEKRSLQEFVEYLSESEV